MMIHDHFNGSAHCVECQGQCRLTGDERAVTALIRFTLERLAYRDEGLSSFQVDALLQLGIDPGRFMLRARECCAGIMLGPSGASKHEMEEQP